MLLIQFLSKTAYNILADRAVLFNKKVKCKLQRIPNEIDYLDLSLYILFAFMDDVHLGTEGHVTKLILLDLSVVFGIVNYSIYLSCPGQLGIGGLVLVILFLL